MFRLSGGWRVECVCGCVLLFLFILLVSQDKINIFRWVQADEKFCPAVRNE